MEALVVTFKTHASQEQFTAAHAENAPVFAEVDGLLAKIWIADPESGTYGGIYLFGDRTALDAYLRAISSRASSRSQASKVRAGAATTCSMS